MLLGASINLKVLVTAAGPAILQALLLISIVFGFTWWLGGRLGLDDKLRALLASAISIIAASIIGTLYLQWVSDGKATIATVNDLRTWFLIFAFVAIGLEFSLKGLREAGWRPIALFASATVVNIAVALGLAVVLFGNFTVS